MRLFCAFVSYPTEDKDYMAGLEATKHKPHRIREDVQAAMRAIGTRSAGDIKLEKSEKFRLKLTGAYLSKANLADVNLAGAMLLNKGSKQKRVTVYGRVRWPRSVGQLGGLFKVTTVRLKVE